MNKPTTKQHLCRTFSALAVIAALAVGVLCASPQAQGSPQPVSGTWYACDGGIVEGTYHQVSLYVATVEVYQDQICSGDMVGTLSVTPDNPEFDVLHFAKDGSLLRASFHGSGTFTGSVLGRTASPAAVFTYQGQIAPDGSGQAIYSLDDPVAGIHGEFTMFGSPPDPCVTGTYTGQFQLTP